MSGGYSFGVGALYLHVPFCVRRCAYCDFVSSVAHEGDVRLDAYVDDRLAELAWCSAHGLLGGCVTAYVGGGTPTLLGEQRIGRLCAAIRDACPNLREFTCEANPDSLSDAVIAALADSGVTRLSVGVQSLDTAELVELGRIHTAEQARERVAAAVQAGFNVSVDLMCAIPLQTDASWAHTLEEAVGLGVDHMSVYPLAIEEHTPLALRYGDDAPFNDEDVQAARMEYAEGMLESAGLARYEVASYARPGRQCEHNIAYWTGVEYLGLGHGAASMLGPAAYDVLRRLFSWLPAWQPGARRMRFSTHVREVEFLSAREAWAEDLMLGMRLTSGIPEEALDGEDGVRDDLLRRGLICRSGGRLVPTHDGWLLGNELFSALWDLSA